MEEKFFVNLSLGRGSVWSVELNETTIKPIEKFLHREMVKRFTKNVILAAIKDSDVIEEHLAYTEPKAKEAMEKWAERAARSEFPGFAKAFPNFSVSIC